MTDASAAAMGVSAPDERIDPVVLEIIRGQLDALCEEMQATLVRSSFSAIVRDLGDTTAVLFDRDGQVLAQSTGIPVHLGVFVACGEELANTFGAGVARPGDIYALNDPYQGGTHLSDIAVFFPVFDGDELVAYTGSMSHHQDVGGSRPGSTPHDSFDLHAEGFRIPLVRIGAEGRVFDLFETLITANTRSPENLRGDLDAQLAACGTGARRMHHLIAKWGSDTLLRTGAQLMDLAERVTRAAIADLPDGTYDYEDWIDDDGFTDEPMLVRVAVRVEGDRLHFDFEGTAPQARSAINNSISSSACAVYFAVHALTRGAAPNNHGSLRTVTANYPEGSLVNPVYPAPCGARSAALGRIGSVVFGAMALAAPELYPADSDGQSNLLTVSGTDPRNGRFVTLLGGPYRGGFGAGAGRDGVDVTDSTLSNGYWIPVEVTERQVPVRVNHLRLWQDSGGAGTYRGGLGCDVEYEWLGEPATLGFRRDRHKFGPKGLFGGDPAPVCRTEVTDPGGQVSSLPAKAQWVLVAGTRLRTWTSGGGGHGPAVERDPERVATDVREGRVSRDAARTSYGVALRPDGTVDQAETQRLRRA